MPVSEDQLLASIESSLFLMTVPGRISEIGISGLQGRVTALSHPLMNLIGCATLDENSVDNAIQQVFERFQPSARAFGWVTSAASRPPDIATRLTAAGMIQVDEMAGMVLRDIDRPMNPNPAVEVTPAADGELRLEAPMFAAAYGLPYDVALLTIEGYVAAGKKYGYTMYFARLPGSPDPIGFGAAVALPDSTMVLLGGAATLPEHRGRGVYNSLVARRLADYRAMGSDTAILQAVRSTSAPLAAKLGFEEVQPLVVYAWLPA